MRFVAVSDVHVDHVTYGVRRFEESIEALRRASDIAITENRAFLFGGDLMDPDCGTASFGYLEKVIEIATRLTHHRVEQVWIAGNHDVIDAKSAGTTLSPLRAALRGHVRAYVAETPGRFPIGDADVVALPFASPHNGYIVEAAALPLIRASRTDGRRVLVLSHLNIPGLQPGEETTEMPRGREVMLPQSVVDAADLTLNGHYHRRQKVSDKLYIIGAPVCFTFGETNHDPVIMKGEI